MNEIMFESSAMIFNSRNKETWTHE